MKGKYEAPEMKGPIECMRGTIGMQWPQPGGKYVAPEIKGPIECMRGTIGMQWNDKKMATVSSQKTISAVQTLQFRDEDFGMIVFNPQTDGLYECNKTAAIILRMLSNGSTKEDILEAFEKNFELGKKHNECETDIENFIKQISG